MTREEIEKLTAEVGEAGVVAEIAAERRHQIDDNGYTAEQDDGYRRGYLARAGVCYALYAATRPMRLPDEEFAQFDDWFSANVLHKHYPWSFETFKPRRGDGRQDLIRAAALIVAEIERMDRAALGDEVCRSALTE